LAYAPIPDNFAVPFGKAKIRKSGEDLTVLAYGTAVHFALEAAQVLESEGYSIEVIDLRSLSPLDEETILQSIEKTHRVVIAHEDKVFGGFGGELAALIVSKAFTWLDAPIERVGSEFTPVGFNRILERAVLPNTEKVLKTIRQTLAF
jgi:2-oxoisovalerate dehydrogenase E1 component